MKYTLKGNYWNGIYTLPSASGPESAEKIETKYCPADLSTTLWQCHISYQHVDKVIESAWDGFEVWKNEVVKKRVEFINRFKKALIDQKEQIINALSLETGITHWESTLEFDETINAMSFAIDNCQEKLKPQQLKLEENAIGNVFYRPLGPSLIIGNDIQSFSFISAYLVPVLLSGNSIILHPSLKLAYSAQLIVDCFHKAEFPKGVINLLQGDKETTKRLLKEKAVKGVYFTGRKEMGKFVIENTYQDLSKLSTLTLSGKNPCIIHKDVDIDSVMAELLKAVFLSCGQRITSTSMVVIHNDIKDEFITKFHTLAKRIIIDHPIESKKQPFLGPLIDKQALDSYLMFIGMAKREGIEEIMRGKNVEKEHKGYYVSPSIHYAKDLNQKGHFISSEIMGPNCTFVSYDTIEQAVEIANKTEFGLVSSIYTKDSKLSDFCLQQLQHGQININTPTTNISFRLPFGGIKNSGNFHPIGANLINSCVYSQSNLQMNNVVSSDIKSLIGLEE
ncbi:MAG: aldehyde dehydrogenase family protein [Bacteriovoracaceae bacterium]|nr:aldehyde dehydrogenase family protein [Bacteriovoracaceae bacterium]